MSTFQNACSLGSFRDCRDETIPRKKMGKILEAGRQAPSPGNVQSLNFIVVESEEKKELLSEMIGDPRLEKVPTLVVILGDLDRMARKVGDSICHDCCNAEAACAVQNMRLTAFEDGIGSCWMTGFDPTRVGELMKVPDGMEALGIVALGYTDEKLEKPTKFGMNEVCYYDEYGNQLDSIFDELEFEGLVETREMVEKKSKGFLDKVRRSLRKHL